MTLKRIMLFLSLFMAIFPISHCNKEPNEKKILAERGVIDLSNVNFDEIETVNLDGEWDFYWKNFYSYEDITQKKIIPDLYFNLGREDEVIELKQIVEEMEKLRLKLK